MYLLSVTPAPEDGYCEFASCTPNFQYSTNVFVSPENQYFHSGSKAFLYILLALD